MSKTKDIVIEAQQSPELAELLTEGKTTIEGESREEVYQKADALVAGIPERTEWTRTIVEHNQGHFAQTYSLIINK